MLCLFLLLGLCTFILFACNALPSKICMVHSFLPSLLKHHLIRQSLLTNHSHSSNSLPCFIFLYHTCLYLVIPYYIFVCMSFHMSSPPECKFFESSGFDILLNALRFILSTYSRNMASADWIKEGHITWGCRGNKSMWVEPTDVWRM